MTGSSFDAPQPPREEFTDISIDEDGKWFTRGRHIRNTRILSYFKENLHRDDKGIYILNQFGRFSEKGYIKVNGPLLAITEVSPEEFTTENGDKISIAGGHVVLDARERPFVPIKSMGAWASFSKNALMQFSEDLEERDGALYWRNQLLKIIHDIKWSEDES